MNTKPEPLQAGRESRIEYSRHPVFHVALAALLCAAVWLALNICFNTGEPTLTWWLRLAEAFEWLALAGIWLAVIMALYFAYRRRAGLIELTALVFTAFAAALGKFDIWASAYATGRTMSPLLIMLGIFALKERRCTFALPLLLVLPRLVLQYEAQLAGIIRGITNHF